MAQLGLIGETDSRNWTVQDQCVDLSGKVAAVTPISFLAEHQPITIDLEKTAVIVVDMQNDFCHHDGWLASIGVDVAPARKPIDALSELLPNLRNLKVPVIWVNWGTRSDRLNLPPNVLHVYDPEGSGVGIGSSLRGNGHKVLEEGSWGAAIVDELEIHETDIHVAKHRMSGFFDTALDSILRNLEVKTLLFAGVNLDQCVFHTLADAACLGYDCVLLSDCAGTTSPSFCAEGALYNIAQCYGFTASSVDLRKALT